MPGMPWTYGAYWHFGGQAGAILLKRMQAESVPWPEISRCR